MFRNYRIALLLIVTVAFAWPISAEGANRVSKNNPYRSFNISGINYGAMQWERENGNRSYTPRGRTFRGRR